MGTSVVCFNDSLAGDGEGVDRTGCEVLEDLGVVEEWKADVAVVAVVTGEGGEVEGGAVV